MKQVPPAIQEKQRYLEFKVHGEEKNLGEVVDSIWSSATEYMGTQGCSEADIWVIGNKFDKEEQEGVIRVHKDRVDDLRAALTLNTGFDDDSFLSVGTISGTVSGLEE